MKTWKAAVALAIFGSLTMQAVPAMATEEFDQAIKNAQSEYQRQQAEQERQRYQQYLKNNDAANGISQRTGPTVAPAKDGGKGGTFGYQWSTK